MSLFRSSIRPSAATTVAVIQRHLERLRADLGPDPAFRSRLRGRVVNEYVATREGLGIRRSAAREMTRIGRAVLYASFVLGVSVTGAMAASQHAIPGDAFYPLKLDVEALRYRVVPDHLHDELAAHALAERMVELDRLVAADRISDVAAQVVVVEAAYDRVIALGAEAPGVEDRMSLVAAILERLPDEARAAVEQAFDGSSGASSGESQAGGQGRGTPRRPMDDPPGRGGTSPAVSTDGDEPAAEPTSEPTEKAQPSAPATANPNASSTPKPKPSQAAEPTRPPHPHDTPSPSPELP